MSSDISKFEQLSAQRKELQEKGSVPSWYTTQAFQMFMKAYYVNGEDYVRGRFETIAKHLAKYVDKERRAYFQKRFFEIQWDGHFGLSTPALANTGTNRGLNVACSGQYVDDSVEGFFDAAKEHAMLTKASFGCSAYVGDVRSRGSQIATGGVAEGPMMPAKILSEAVDHVKQGTRRGSTAIYFDFADDGFDEVIDFQKTNVAHFNSGFVITNKDIKKTVWDCDPVYEARFKALNNLKLTTGKGYLFFKDKVAAHRPQMYKDKGLDVKASNLCVAPETLILTDRGHVKISDVVGQQVNVWNGEEWSEVTVCETGENQKLLTVVVESISDDGVSSELTCTEYHKWYLEDGSCVRTIDLKPGMQLLSWTDDDGNQFSDRVWGIHDEGRYDDTYCFSEPKRHMGVFNGILTGQCTEIMLHSSPEYTFSCVLGSMNVARYDEWKDTDAAYVATVMLDCIVSDFLKQIKGKKYFKKIHDFTKNGRAIGLGCLGVATYFQDKMIPYDDIEADILDDEIHKHIHDESLRASQDMAKWWGEPEWCKGYCVRNTHRTAYAPTKTNALLMGGVSESFSPEYAVIYEQGSSAGNMFRIPAPFLRLMKEKGKYDKETMDDIVKRLGSCQHVDWLTDKEKDVFKKASEFDQMVLLQRASNRQKWICQGQSINFWFAGDATEEDVSRVMTAGWLDPNILSLYYFYSESGLTVDAPKKKEAQECESCQA